MIILIFIIICDATIKYYIQLEQIYYLIVGFKELMNKLIDLAIRIHQSVMSNSMSCFVPSICVVRYGQHLRSPNITYGVQTIFSYLFSK